MASISQTLLFTALPAGHTPLPDGSTGVRLSILVSPRLIPPAAEGKLAEFPDLLDWPKTVQALRFHVSFAGGLDEEFSPDFSRQRLQPELWRRLFQADTFVRGHAFRDLKDTVVRGFPATEVYGFIRDLYEELAINHGEAHPTLEGATSPYGTFVRDVAPLRIPLPRQSPLGGPESKFERQLVKDRAIAPGTSPTSLGFANAQQQAFYQATRFYDRPEARAGNTYLPQPKPELAPASPTKPRLDFHECLTALADYPTLMRRLGLVLDLVIPAKKIPATGRVAAKPLWQTARPAFHRDGIPSETHYEFDAEIFLAASADPKESELQRGYLDLRLADDAPPRIDRDKRQPAPYKLAQIDVDGSALKAVDFAGNLARMRQPQVRNYRTPTEAAAPSLRSGGVALLRRHRDWKLHQRFQLSAKLQQKHLSGGTSALFAEDLLRGYRIDVWDDKTDAWHSLTARRGRYLFDRDGDELVVEIDDEGYVKSASVSRADDGAGPPDLYAHERVVEFDGWSLVAPRPGKVIPDDPAATEPASATPTVETEFGFAARFKVPAGSLPRLRFGRRYRLRARWVDLAGNSIPFETATNKFASGDIRFSRFEPVGSPSLQLRERVTEGESLEHMVVRSDYDRSAEAYADDPAVNAILDRVRERLQISPGQAADYAYAPANERHVAPPKVAQQTAELHGRFDAYIGPGAPHAAGYLLAAREAASFLSRTIVNLGTGHEDPIPGLQLELVPPAGGTPTDLDDPNRKPGDALQTGEYVLHREEQLIVPYLADPLAVGVVFYGLPGVPPHKPTVVGFEGVWPDVMPFRIRLVERPGTMDGCDQTFSGDGKPTLPTKADRALTVFLPKGVMARVRYASIYPQDEGEATLGLLGWMKARQALTATRRKLAARGGHWMITPWRTLTLVHAVQHPLCPPIFEKLSIARQLGETFARLRGQLHLSVKSTAKLDVLATWNEPIDDVAQPAPQEFERRAHAVELVMDPVFDDHHPIPAGETGAPPASKKPPEHEFGDTKHRHISYHLKGTTRFREYFPIELTRDESAITREGAPTAIHVPSSARPAAPKPVYIIPTFRWHEQPLANHGVVRIRHGNGLRVYLERPWWSSGADERLGVVFKSGAVPDELKPFCTQWGLDPAFDSDAPFSGPTAAAFKRGLESATSRSIEELGAAKRIFNVVGPAVEFDAARKLWFSDLEIAAGLSYFPFVRLALARFQPYSILHAELSRVVQTDFVQLVPDRTLELRWTGPRTARIVLYGPSPKQTYLSRLLTNLTTVRSSAPANILPRNLAQTDVVQAFTPGTFTAVDRPDLIQINPDLFKVKAEPADLSDAPGLNEYTAVVETLADGASPDFEWKPLPGVTFTKPRKAQRPVTKAEFTALANPPLAQTKSARAGAKVTQAQAAAKVSAATSTTASVRPELVFELAKTLPSFLRKKLWEADLNLPAGELPSTLRVVCREHELYLKATPAPGDFIPIARRMVYADIAPLQPPA